MLRNRSWNLVLFLVIIAKSVTWAAAPVIPDIKSNHRDIQDPEYFDKAPSPKNKKGKVGKDFEEFGEEVAQRIDKIVSRRGFRFLGDPWTLQGIPLLFPSADTGFNLGLNAVFANVKREDPHEMEIAAQALASDAGRYKHFLRLDLPHAFNDQYHITGRVSYNRDINFRYFGIGNETPADRELIKADSIIYKNQRTGPGFNLAILKYVNRYFQMGPLLGLKWTDVTYPTGSLLDNEKPLGIAGGKTHNIGFAFVYDALDFAPNPRRGNFHELFLNWSTKYLGSDYDFLRSTYTFRRFWSLYPTLTLAHRTLFEVISGDAPFFELGAVGGSDSTIGFGGDKFIRGYQSNRFIDHIKMALGFELRWEAFEFGWAKQKLEVVFAPWVDLGRVWNQLLPLQIGTIHASTGWGTRITWNDRFIIRGDFALTPEGSALYVELGHSF
jgi:hypothetical protein